MIETDIAGSYQEFDFRDANASHVHRYFLPPLFKLCGSLRPEMRVLDVGCGNGYTVGQFLERGCREVVGIDLSKRGIEEARKTYHAGRFEQLPADEHLLANLKCEPFDLVISTEVIEHLYAPRPYATGCFQSLRPGGRFILSTPYHGYWKNLSLALLGKWDFHAIRWGAGGTLNGGGDVP